MVIVVMVMMKMMMMMIMKVIMRKMMIIGVVVVVMMMMMMMMMMMITVLVPINKNIGHFEDIRETGLKLCRIAPWDCFGYCSSDEIHAFTY